MQTSRPSACNPMAPVAGWKAPERPENSKCPCGTTIEPIFNEPQWWGGRLLFDSGKWIVPALCAPCQADANAKWNARLEAEAAAEAAARFSRQVADNLRCCGLSPIHRTMELENWKGATEANRESVLGWVEGKHGLYLWGTPGTGKTHAAVSALKARIRTTGKAGAFRIVPEMAIELRRAAKNHGDSAILDSLSGVDALVLDDLGSERATEFVEEQLYLLADRFWRNEMTGLIITSNLPLGEMAERVSERFVSRIAGICRTVKLDGPDHRLAGRGARQ